MSSSTQVNVQLVRYDTDLILVVDGKVVDKFYIDDYTEGLPNGIQEALEGALGVTVGHYEND